MDVNSEQPIQKSRQEKLLLELRGRHFFCLHFCVFVLNLFTPLGKADFAGNFCCLFFPISASHISEITVPI